MSYNQISTLKGLQLSYLSRLEILDLSNNKIPRLDVNFPFSLSTLMLANNNITELPTSLTALSNLQTLQLTGEIGYETILIVSTIVVHITPK